MFISCIRYLIYQNKSDIFFINSDILYFILDILCVNLDSSYAILDIFYVNEDI